MRAVSVDARHNSGMAIEEERDIVPLHDGSDRFGAVDQHALVALGQAQEDSSDIGRF
jgi:hypothetical protein